MVVKTIPWTIHQSFNTAVWYTATAVLIRSTSRYRCKLAAVFLYIIYMSTAVRDRLQHILYIHILHTCKYMHAIYTYIWYKHNNKQQFTQAPSFVVAVGRAWVHDAGRVISTYLHIIPYRTITDTSIRGLRTEVSPSALSSVLYTASSNSFFRP